MPARSVVIERLTKFNGERHEVLTPAEYTQLTGRAGRRGIDPIGTRRRAVVAVRAASTRWRRWPAAGVRPPLGVPAHLQHGRQPDPPPRPRDGPTSCSTSRSPSTRPTAPWSSSNDACRSAVDALADGRGRGGLRAAATSAEYRDLAQPHRRLAGSAGSDSSRPWRRLRPGDVIAHERPADGRRALGGVPQGRGDQDQGRRPRRATSSSSACPTSTSPRACSATVDAPAAVPPRRQRLPARGGGAAARESSHRRSHRARRRHRACPRSARPSGRRHARTPSAHVRALERAERLRREVDELARRIDSQTGTIGRAVRAGPRLLDVGLRRRLGGHRAGRAARRRLPRGRSGGRRGHRVRPASTVSTLPSSRPWSRCSSTSTGARAAARTLVPVAPRARAGRRHRRHRAPARRPTRRRRPARVPRRRPRFPGMAHDWCAGEALGACSTTATRADRRRLRADDPPAHRPAPPDRPAGARRRRPGPRPAAATGALERGVVVRHRPPSTLGRGRGPMTIRKGEPWGQPGAAARRRRASSAPTPRPAPWSPPPGEATRPVPAARPARRRPVPDVRRSGDEARLRGPEAQLAAGRPRRGPGRRTLHWFVAHLVARRAGGGAGSSP